MKTSFRLKASISIISVVFLSIISSIKIYADEYIPVKGIDINTKSMTLWVGESRYVGAKVLPDNAGNSGITYSSTDTNVAIVEPSGNVIAVGEGNCNIKAYTNEGNYSDYCNVIVLDNGPKNLPVTAINIKEKNPVIEAGDMIKLNAIISPSNTSNNSVSWESSYPMTAIVTGNGTVAGISPGYAIITCTSLYDTRIKNSIVVTVTNANPYKNYINAAKNINTNTDDKYNPTHSTALNFMTISQIMMAAPNSKVIVEQETPMSYDASVAAMLVNRPDISLACRFKMNGVKFELTLPAGFNLASRLDKTGYIDWINLCTDKTLELKIVN